jgi:predicted secreted protein
MLSRWHHWKSLNSARTLWNLFFRAEFWCHFNQSDLHHFAADFRPHFTHGCDLVRSIDLQKATMLSRWHHWKLLNSARTLWNLFFRAEFWCHFNQSDLHHFAANFRPHFTHGCDLVRSIDLQKATMLSRWHHWKLLNSARTLWNLFFRAEFWCHFNQSDLHHFAPDFRPHFTHGCDLVRSIDLQKATMLSRWHHWKLLNSARTLWNLFFRAEFWCHFNQSDLHHFAPDFRPHFTHGCDLVRSIDLQKATMLSRWHHWKLLNSARTLWNLFFRAEFWCHFNQSDLHHFAPDFRPHFTHGCYLVRSIDLQKATMLSRC